MDIPRLRRPGDILAVGAARYRDAVALRTASRTLTYVELDQLSARAAHALRRRGVGLGERVSIYAENRWEWIVAYHGVLRAGCVVNPLNVMLTPPEVAYAVTNCEATAMFASGTKLSALLDARADLGGVELLVSFDDGVEGTVAFDTLLAEPVETTATDPFAGNDDTGALCSIAYTSGTTGFPKGAMHSHDAVLLNCAHTASMHVRTADDIVVTALPAPHVYGNVVINSIFLAGGTLVLLERFEPGAALAAIAEHRATMFEGVPAMYATMLAHPALATTDLSSLTRSTVGGQTISNATMEAWEAATGAPLIELWGMTELAGLGTTHPLYAPNVHGSIGIALPGIEAKITDFDDSTKAVAPGEAGELLIRGPIVMMGYYGNEKATNDTILDGGWMCTGDVAVQDARGYISIVDRRKDLIITGGYNVYPAEIERVIASHPAVAMVAVGRVPDETRGELARAYVVLRPGANATEAEIIDHCRGQLAAYKLPRSVRFVDDFPKTSSGKIMRRELNQLDT